MEYPGIVFDGIPDKGDVPLLGHRARDRPRLVPHDRRLERAPQRLHGRGLQHLHRHRRVRRPTRAASTAPSATPNIPQAASRRTRSSRCSTIPSAADPHARRRLPRPRSATRSATSREPTAWSCCASRSSGPDRFDWAFRKYIRDWAYKHPSPSDFFREMQSEGGEDLGWFWRGWYLNNWKYDVAVDKIDGARQ